MHMGEGEGEGAVDLCVYMLVFMVEGRRGELGGVRASVALPPLSSLTSHHPPLIYVSYDRWYVEFERTAKDLSQIELRKSGKVRWNKRC